METVWYDGPSGGEHVPNPSVAWMHEVMQRDEEYWGPYSPVGVLAWHKHRPQKERTRVGLGTRTQQSQLLFVRHPKRGWYFEYSTSNQPKDRWLVPLDPAADQQKWVKHWSCGEQLYFLSACFVPQELAEQILTDYLSNGAPSPAVQWVEFESILPRKDPDSYREWRRVSTVYPLLRFSGSVEHDPAVAEWFDARPGELGTIARKWFVRMRSCGADVRELLHDGCPVVCVEEAPFGYVNAFRAHVNVGFFHGRALRDPAGLLEGSGKYMRHVKVKPDSTLDGSSLEALITAAYLDIGGRLKAADPVEGS